jgi:hypothetical protein
MQPFRVHDRKEKTTWVIINFHPQKGTYLAYRQQDDSEDDGVLVELTVDQVTGCRMIDFMTEAE